MKATRGDRMSLRAANVNYCFSQKRLGFGSEFQFSPIWGGGDIRIVPAGRLFAFRRPPLRSVAIMRRIPCVMATLRRRSLASAMQNRQMMRLG